MRSAGIDVGSRTVKLAVVENGKAVISRKSENSFNPLEICGEMLDGIDYDVLTATGYGRHLLGDRLSCDIISEIKAFAIGARELLPSCRTIVDIGGQDIKAISLDENGRVIKFEMNDKCSAGTGRSLEIMAMALGSRLDDFDSLALTAEKTEKISSLCTVFAESEVISLVSRGAKREDVALGIHQAIVNRLMGMLRRINVREDVLFAGGVAYNKCIRDLLQKSSGADLHVPDDPQIIGALGCAIYGMKD
ncbi:MAG: 3-hydroxyacyl-ACP dehydratase [candidate division Zixibacteria bacterium]|nr:3-hydroxyacyl-ACP dehydratase [candidate division Zixibacteria bacterium]